MDSSKKKRKKHIGFEIIESQAWDEDGNPVQPPLYVTTPHSMFCSRELPNCDGAAHLEPWFLWLRDEICGCILSQSQIPSQKPIQNPSPSPSQHQTIPSLNPVPIPKPTVFVDPMSISFSKYTHVDDEPVVITTNHNHTKNSNNNSNSNSKNKTTTAMWPLKPFANILSAETWANENMAKNAIFLHQVSTDPRLPFHADMIHELLHRTIEEVTCQWIKEVAKKFQVVSQKPPPKQFVLPFVCLPAGKNKSWLLFHVKEKGWTEAGFSHIQMLVREIAAGIHNEFVMVKDEMFRTEEEIDAVEDKITWWSEKDVTQDTYRQIVKQLQQFF